MAGSAHDVRLPDDVLQLLGRSAAGLVVRVALMAVCTDPMRKTVVAAIGWSYGTRPLANSFKSYALEWKPSFTGNSG